MNLWFLIFIIFFLLYKNNSGKIRANFDEIFGNEWDKNESEEKAIKIKQNDQNEQNENSATVDQMDEEMGNGPIDRQKRETIRKFEAIKEKLKEKENFHEKNINKIERKIGKLLGENRIQIYKWKKELNLNKIKIMKKSFYEEKKKEFIERFDEFKNLYKGKQKEFVKELGIGETTFRKWKKELMPNYHKTPNKYSNVDKLRKMKQYLEIKGKNAKISEKIIAKKLGISGETLYRWKKEYVSDMIF